MMSVNDVHENIFVVVKEYDDYEICGGSSTDFFLSREAADNEFNRVKSAVKSADYVWAAELRYADMACNGCLIPGSLIERWECPE